jgi:hypothetical protein
VKLVKLKLSSDATSSEKEYDLLTWLNEEVHHKEVDS